MPTYVIDRRQDRHHSREVWRVWELVPQDEPVLVGEYDTLDSAKASLAVSWSPPDRPEHGDWDYIGRALEEEEDTEYAQDERGTA